MVILVKNMLLTCFHCGEEKILSENHLNPLSTIASVMVGERHKLCFFFLLSVSVTPHSAQEQTTGEIKCGTSRLASQLLGSFT